METGTESLIVLWRKRGRVEPGKLSKITPREVAGLKFVNIVSVGFLSRLVVFVVVSFYWIFFFPKLNKAEQIFLIQDDIVLKPKNV